VAEDDRDDDLETTMRHGLRELANDAPRGDGLWNTTTSMIAIQADQPSPESSASAPAPAAKQDEQPPHPDHSLALGIAIGIAIALLVAVIVLIVLLVSSHSSSHSAPPTSATTVSTTPPARSQPGKATSAVMPAGPIPSGDIVFNDDTTGRIVVADGTTFNEIGVIEPSDTSAWTALGLSPDRSRLYVASTSPVNRCKEAWALDLASHQLTQLVSNADVVALSPDASRAIVRWDGDCATNAAQPNGQVALRDLAAQHDTVLSSVPAALADEAAWSPDGSRVAILPAGVPHVVVYNAQGGVVGQIDRPSSGQSVVGWTSSGFLLVDLGNDKTAVVRLYDPISGQPITPVVRVPQVPADGDHGALVTPTVTAIREVDGKTFVEIAGSTPTSTYAQLRVIANGQVPVAVNGWFGREVVG
jgi:hypothetical protein